MTVVHKLGISHGNARQFMDVGLGKEVVLGSFRCDHELPLSRTPGISKAIPALGLENKEIHPRSPASAAATHISGGSNVGMHVRPPIETQNAAIFDFLRVAATDVLQPWPPDLNACVCGKWREVSYMYIFSYIQAHTPT